MTDCGVVHQHVPTVCWQVMHQPHVPLGSWKGYLTLGTCQRLPSRGGHILSGFRFCGLQLLEVWVGCLGFEPVPLGRMGLPSSSSSTPLPAPCSLLPFPILIDWEPEEHMSLPAGLGRRSHGQGAAVGNTLWNRGHHLEPSTAAESEVNDPGSILP